MIIGVEKAGTTALFRHLCQSPKVSSHSHKEMSYFSSDFEFQKGWANAAEKYLGSSDSSGPEQKKLVICKDAMLAYNSVAMRRLKQQCPRVKSLIILRDPADRAYSAFHHALYKGVETEPNFEDALSKEASREKEGKDYWESTLYLRNGTYSPIIKEAFETFGRNNVFVMFHKHYKEQPELELSRIETFMGERFIEQSEMKFGEHNNSSKPRYRWLAQATYRFMNSGGMFRRILSSILPHTLALGMRKLLDRINRVEAEYKPLPDATRHLIYRKLSEDRRELERLLGPVPWGNHSSAG